ncbi:GNAT family N-acetyltransferase [Lentibacter algarum]|uniref:GNAT family N-acetyltransferase n=1 Tax=Lentibacter algarum TaxID=576131 RepID=UPI001C07B032|nr:GNAT family N-acyltransferase [Lentibacter algarum]MBU2982202.1 GNAT family N-acetyltransferase [Lentibacter algarum]
MSEGDQPRYTVRLATSDEDIRAAQRLRHKTFLGNDQGLEADKFDPACHHVLIECCGQLVACYRLLHFENGSGIQRSYSAQYYDLTKLEQFAGAMVEIGRFCIDPSLNDADILRVAWGALTAYVDENNIEMLFGCSSFQGVDQTAYLDAFCLLKERHLGPDIWRVKAQAPSVVHFDKNLPETLHFKRAQMQLPPLLRTYLLMGGWVSDHAVIDHEMNTLHVFTGLEISAIPAARKRLLRGNAVKIA